MISSRMFQMALSWINGLFVDYHLKPSTMKLELGKNIGRAKMWKITHKKKNGTYANDEGTRYIQGSSSVLSSRDILGSSGGNKTT
ncbi:hypothetical protein DEO72_LG3g1797 [Vigna unguiculata]|uniref:Uncharacterized protein n=1 Tax=Vigna unguiculata TaxID=3917 RepID=A0A4D6LFL0_VIGUN|nr:hypothetical protein DEO72_LG3g1797 [Vigna unguiculata]